MSLNDFAWVNYSSILRPSFRENTNKQKGHTKMVHFITLHQNTVTLSTSRPVGPKMGTFFDFVRSVENGCNESITISRDRDELLDVLEWQGDEIFGGRISGSTLDAVHDALVDCVNGPALIQIKQ